MARPRERANAPIFWLDGLDIRLVQFLDASFAENLGEDGQPVGRPEGESLARYGANMLPVGYEKRTRTSPIFNYSCSSVTSLGECRSN